MTVSSRGLRASFWIDFETLVLFDVSSMVRVPPTPPPLLLLFLSRAMVVDT